MLQRLQEAFLGTFRNDNTRATYAQCLGRFLEEAGLNTLNDFRALTVAQAERAAHSLARSSSPKTASLCLTAARSFGSYLVREGYLKANPLREAKGPKVGDNVPHDNVLRPHELEALTTADLTRLERAVTICLLTQGWRASGLCSLTWRDVEQDSKGWSIEVLLKGGRRVRQRLRPESVEALQDLWEGMKAKASDFLFTSSSGKQLTRYDVHKIVTRSVQKACGRTVTPHGLRATCGSRMISEKGIEAARQWLMHSSINTTVRYSRWSVVE